ncbi:Flagellar motility protein MotE, a chaperone for MotC folding [Paenibacillus alvei]|uniref:Flagellar motility protein MotE, a chaperone for MotC folding n=2 Tax=Paenibacillus alvei TaxID=44250 RepID=A0A383R893_PAEAL|nr:Flagellar motility protein MotE, a chaperone for MotC folding [Paenibacillus alvei]
MSEMMTEEKESNYSGFERFLFFVTPIIFAIILIGVLLTLFNANWRSQLVSIASEIPIVNKWVTPEEAPKEKAKEEKKAQKEETKAQSEQITELKALLASKDQDLRVLADKRKSLEGEVSELKHQLQSLKSNHQEQQANQEQYDRQIKDLANVYAKMMPSKAAPILENMATEEIVLVLNAMKQDNRVKVLEKMNPKVAAEASMMLKDIKPSDNLEIRALQARLKKNENSKEAQTGLDRSQLSKTFSSMTPKSGASFLLETAKINPDKALTVLSSVDDATRSKLINAMTDIDKTKTAKLVAKLLPNQ